MTWTEKQPILARLGYTGFLSEEHFENWINWELDNPIEEKRIKNALCL